MLGLGAAAHAGVWVRERGGVYLQTSVQHSRSERSYGPDGVLRESVDEVFMGDDAPVFDEGHTATTDLVTYGELGLGHGFELVGSLPVRIASGRYSFASDLAPDVVNGHVGFGDAALGARFGRVIRSSALSVLAAVHLPLYDNDHEVLRTQAGNSDFYDDRVPLGNGTVDFDLSAGAGTSWGWGWALLEAGGRIRNRQYSAAIPGRIQVGFRPIHPVALWLGADGVQSLGNGRAPDFYVDEWGKGPTVVDDQSYVAGTIGASVDATERLGFYAGGSRVIAASSYPLLTSISAGVILKLSVVKRVEGEP